MFWQLQVIDLGDSMTFAETSGQADTLTCNVPDVPVDGSNLVIKVSSHPGKQVILNSLLDGWSSVCHAG